MAKMLYFFKDIELDRITSLDNKAFAARWPDEKGLRVDSFSKMVGTPVGVAHEWNAEAKAWDRKFLPVQRKVQFKSNPSLHECNAKCQNATGFLCECSCRGKNHGLGRFVCE